MVSIAAVIYAILMSIVMLFQLALTLGVPWGEASMGGKFKGKYPPKMRVVSFVNMLVLWFIMIVVLIRSGLMVPEFQPDVRITFWFALGFTVLSAIMNWMTPSKIERNIWGPVTAIQLVCILIIAFNTG